MVSHLTGRGVYRRRGNESNYGWTRNTGRIEVRSGSSVFGEPFCLVLHLAPWRNEATSCNAAIRAPARVVVLAWHFQRVSGLSMVPEKRPVGTSPVGR